MDWIRGPTIGRGATATVSLATSIPSGELFAVKSAHLSRSMLLQREQSFLSKLSSPHIVKYLGYDVTNSDNYEPTYNLCMEYVPGGSLYDEIQRRGGRLDEHTIKLHAQQILKGLNYLHVNGLVHCDVKSKNVLLGEEGVKIADLGCAKSVRSDVAFAGTPAFMAPEVARGEEQGFAADIWALGCTIIEMATGSPPWPELKDPVSALYMIGFSCDVPEIPSWLSNKAREFLNNCLKREAEDRWAAQELLEHPFFDEIEKPNDLKPMAESSPCGVLDQSFWSSVETSESPGNSVHTGCSLNFPRQRIKNLIGFGDTLPPVSSSLTWSEDNWITVRSNDDIEESKRYSDDEKDPITQEETSLAAAAFLDSQEQESESSMLDEDLLWEYYSVENVNSFSTRTCFMLDCDSIGGGSFVSDNLNFETDNGNSCSIHPNLSYSDPTNSVPIANRGNDSNQVNLIGGNLE